MKPEMDYRLHQKQMTAITKNILNGASIKEVLAAITPGAGKSMLPIILAHWLIPSFADKICWLVPRSNLRWQGSRNFIDRDFIKLIKHRCQVRASGNDPNPSRGTQGYITTYQGVVSDPILHWKEFLDHRYILFLDEPHHIARQGPWQTAVQGLVDRAALTVYASGTFERGDKQPIAFLPYVEFGKKEILDLNPTTDRRVINYSRVDAIAQGAIIKLHFEMLDARAEWVDNKGRTIQVDSLDEEARSQKDHRAALRTALTTEYANQLLDGCVAQWLAHRKTIYSLAKLLVVAPNISIAKTYKAYLEELTGLKVLIATSDDSKEARANIKLYGNSRQHNILITVGMAYEGLDVKQIAFIACLTFIRSKPWLEQCFARANRNAPGKDYGVIWGPRDHFFLQVIERIVKQQTDAAAERKKKEDDEEDGPGPPAQNNGIAVISSEGTSRSAMDFVTGDDVSSAEAIHLLEMADRVGMTGQSTFQLSLFADEVRGAGYEEPSEYEQISLEGVPVPILTVDEQEDKLRNQIVKFVRGYCIRNAIDWAIPHRMIKERFGDKSIKIMTLDELKAAWAFTQEVFKG